MCELFDMSEIPSHSGIYKISAIPLLLGRVVMSVATGGVTPQAGA